MHSSEHFLNAWCELSARDLRVRHPRSKVGLLPDPQGKGTDSWSMWTPSSPYFMSWLTTFAKPGRRKSARLLKPPSARVRSSPSLCSPPGADSPAKGTSTATLMVICEEHSLHCQAAPS